MSQASEPPDQTGSHPDGLPHVFVDRSLGRVIVPRLLREAGLRLTTLAEHYGIPRDESVADVTWMEDTARLRWAVFIYAVHAREIRKMEIGYPRS